MHHCDKCPLNNLGPKYIPNTTDFDNTPVDILFVLESPNIHTAYDQRYTTNEDRNAFALQYLYHTKLEEIQRRMGDIYGDKFNLSILHGYSFGVSCLIGEDTPKQFRDLKYHPSKMAYDCCRNVCLDTILKINPKIIIPVGDAVCKSLFIPFKKYEQIVAKTSKVHIRGREFTAIPIFKLENINVHDRFYNITSIAVETAINSILSSRANTHEQLDISGYQFPQTVEEVRDICRNIIIPRTSGDNKAFLAVDIETNSRFAYRKDSKVIMLSFSWGEGESCAIWYDSKHSPYKWEDVREYIQEVLASNSRKVFHNAQFDYKFLAYNCGFIIKNLCWDTMLTEHLLDENKKGFYNLEFLAGYYFPVFENYKKLALKKISSKDTMNEYAPIIDEDNSEYEATESEDAETPSLTNAFQEELTKYEELVALYEEEKLSREVQKKVYEQQLQLWENIKQGEKPKKPKFAKLEKPKKPDLSKFLGEETKSNFEDYDPQDLAIYCAMDSDITRRIAEKQKLKILKEDPRMLTIIAYQHVPAIKALSEMEFIGANTDLKYLDTLETILKEDHDNLLSTLKRLAQKDDFKPNSGPHISYVLYNLFAIKHDPLNVTAKGAPKTDKATMNKLMDTYKDSRPEVFEFLETLLKFKDVAKAYGTTVKNFRKHTEYDGRLRTNYHQNGTTTGRLASSNLNLQNLSKIGGNQNLKNFIIPDREDHVVVQVDISNAEMRCLLAYAPEESLINGMKSGLDTHCLTASEVWLSDYPQYSSSEDFYKDLYNANQAEEPTSFQKELKKVRKNTKAVNFGLIYGITRYGLSRDLGCSEEEAQALIEKYFKRYQAIKRYMDSTDRKLKLNREVQSLTFRKRRFPRYDLNSFRCYRQGINFCIQNISSDLVVRILGNMNQLVKKELGGRLILTVHDSILMSVPKENLHLVHPFMRKCIVEYVETNYKWLPVSFAYDVEYGNAYGDMKRLNESH